MASQRGIQATRKGPDACFATVSNLKKSEWISVNSSLPFTRSHFVSKVLASPLIRSVSALNSAGLSVTANISGVCVSYLKPVRSMPLLLWSDIVPSSVSLPSLERYVSTTSLASRTYFFLITFLSSEGTLLEDHKSFILEQTASTEDGIWVGHEF